MDVLGKPWFPFRIDVIIWYQNKRYAQLFQDINGLITFSFGALECVSRNRTDTEQL